MSSQLWDTQLQLMVTENRWEMRRHRVCAEGVDAARTHTCRLTESALEKIGNLLKIKC